MGSFKVKFNLADYKDILPDYRDYLKHDYIINFDDFEKGNIDNCVWTRHTPTPQELSSKEFREREIKRILKTGAWVAIKDEIIWIPPNYYNALQYGKAGNEDMAFRLKRLKNVYFKIQARNNPQCKGTFCVKNRQDGDTTIAMHDAFYESLIMDVGQIGIQSKTRDDAKNPCWSTLQTLWLNYPQWLKDELCSDFTSGSNIAETMKFMREADEANGITARNVLLAYYPAVYNAMDGKNNMKKCILDEVLKWVECNLGETINCYSKFIMPGFERRGLFEMFSSPPAKDCQSFRDGYELWLKSDTNNMQPNGTTESRIHRYASDPLEGIHGAYDKWGDADPEKIYAWIMAERKACPKDKILDEIRGFPLNEEERWGTLEGGDFWSNYKGINERKIYLLGTRFKSEETKEPKVIYGNLEWENGVRDSKPVFKQSDKSEFDVHTARFCFSYMPDDDSELRDIFNPPSYVENCIGIDSVDKRYPGKKPSNFAMVNHKFRDAKNSGIIKCPTMIYCNRPAPIEVAYEDAIKAAVFVRSLVQVESLNTKIVDYFEDRGYINWLLSKMGQPRNSLVKGDAPSGKTAFMSEIVGMIDAITGLPGLGEEKSPLILNWFYELLEDVSKFDMKDTHERDLTMAWGQSLLGAAKIMFKKQMNYPEFNQNVFEYLFS